MTCHLALNYYLCQVFECDKDGDYDFTKKYTLEIANSFGVIYDSNPSVSSAINEKSYCSSW